MPTPCRLHPALLQAAAAAATVGGRPVLGAVCYSAALNHKQMTLYYAPAFFTHMLGLCLQRGSVARKVQQLGHGCCREGLGPGPGCCRAGEPASRAALVPPAECPAPDLARAFLLSSQRLAAMQAGLFGALGVAVVGTFALLWLPVARHPSSPAAVLRRVFPTQRGLFEDYVANVWCVSSLAVKWRRLLSQGQLLALCAAGTLCALAPAAASQLARPSRRGLALALANSALAFFLFGYQVHEKSVLLPLLALGLLGGDVADLAQHAAVFSMLPLLRKDGLATAAVGALLLYAGARAVARDCSAGVAATAGSPPGAGLGWRRAKAVFLGGAAALTAGFALFPPPARYPFLEDAACMAWSLAALLGIFAATNAQQWAEFRAAGMRGKAVLEKRGRPAAETRPRR